MADLEHFHRDGDIAPCPTDNRHEDAAERFRCLEDRIAAACGCKEATDG